MILTLLRTIRIQKMRNKNKEGEKQKKFYKKNLPIKRVILIKKEIFSFIIYLIIKYLSINLSEKYIKFKNYAIRRSSKE